MKKSVRTRQQNYNSRSSSNATPIRQLRVQNKTVATPFCSNHQTKVATHRLHSEQSQEMLFYCEKCSIMLASQGFNVMRVHNQSKLTNPKSRFQQIQNFLKNLDQTIQILGDRYTQVEQQLINSQESYGTLVQKAQSYFHSLHQVIELQKYICYNNILSRRAASEADLRMLKENLKISIIDIQGMMEDIQNNFDAVQGVQYTIYSSIMAGYQQKLQSIPALLNIQSKLPTKFQITIPEIPNLLYSLADKLCLKNMTNPPTPFKVPVKNQLSKQCSRVSHLKPYCQAADSKRQIIQQNRDKMGFSFDSKDNGSGARESKCQHQASRQQKLNYLESLDGYFNHETIGNQSYQQKMEETDTLLIT